MIFVCTSYTKQVGGKRKSQGYLNKRREDRPNLYINDFVSSSSRLCVVNRRPLIRPRMRKHTWVMQQGPPEQGTDTHVVLAYNRRPVVLSTETGC